MTPILRADVLNLAKLPTMAYEASKANGWYEGYRRSDEEIAQLIITEYVEASEEVRNNRPLVYVINEGVCPLQHLGFESCTVIGTTPEHPTENKVLKYLKPEGELVELADGAIRICDYFGAHKLDLVSSLQSMGIVDKLEGMPFDAVAKACYDLVGEKFEDRSPLASHLSIIAAVADIEKGLSARRAFTNAFAATLAYSVANEFDLAGAIALKMSYNQTRGYRHGGKAL